MYEVTLVIIFNHKFNRNIPILNEIYKNRFSDIVYIVPFYQKGEVDDEQYEILSVYDSSYSFEGYIAQSYTQLMKHNSKSYMFIGDDLILNPRINENSFRNFFGIQETDSYNTEICKINEPFGCYRWNYSRVFDCFMCFKNNRFVNFKSEIPSKDQAYSIVQKKGYLGFDIKKDFYLSEKGIRGRIKTLILKGKKIPEEVKYPLFGGYSDLCIVAADDFKLFSHYLGVFSAIGLFVEVAIPTAMVLACNEIKEQKDTDYERGDIWGIDNKNSFGEKYEFSLKRLFNEWPESKLFIHPIKLSQWKI